MRKTLRIAFVTLVTALAAGAQTYSVFSLQGSAQGQAPTDIVIHGGAIYGGTEFGGGAESGGAVYELAPPAGGLGWQDTVLLDMNPAIGREAYITVAAPNGVIYGVTATGGTGNCTSPDTANGCGTVFQMTPPGGTSSSWTVKVLYRFRGGTDGAYPTSLIMWSGLLSGATSGGGGSAACPAGCGTIFYLSPPISGDVWSETVVYAFQGANDGAYPRLFAPSAGATVGALYGTSQNANSTPGGTVFEVYGLPQPTGWQWVERTIYAFTGTGDGSFPGIGGGRPDPDILRHGALRHDRFRRHSLAFLPLLRLWRGVRVDATAGLWRSLESDGAL